MDPTSFTQTSFCGSQVDNITENEAKQYILNQMSIRCSGNTYKTRYAKVYNEQYQGNLRNPHVVCLKSSGTPYLLFITQINETNYTFLIDKKIKEGYEYPKIFILPYYWSPEIYQGTLLECELIRDRNKNWFLSIGDMYYEKGKPMNQVIVIERINQIHRMIEDHFMESEFTKTCKIFIKRYFDYKDITHVVQEYIPTLTYDIRGFYFVPMRCSYSKIVYLLPRDNPLNARRQVPLVPVDVPLVPVDVPLVPVDVPLVPVDVQAEEFTIMKTMKPDVYEVYSSREGYLKKEGLLLVQTTSHSKGLYHLFKGTQGQIKLRCRYNERFQKWEPKI
jgi:hypothetical protein